MNLVPAAICSRDYTFITREMKEKFSELPLGQRSSIARPVRDTPFMALLQDAPVSTMYFHALLLSVIHPSVTPMERKVFVARLNMDGKGFRTLRDIGSEVGGARDDQITRDFTRAAIKILHNLEVLRSEEDLSVLGPESV